MKPIIKNVLAVICGVFIGSVVNMGIINISDIVIPHPAGVDVSSMESLQATMHLFEPKHFIMPFLAHALGTLIGAFFAAFIAASHKMIFAYSIGCFFLLGGIMSVIILPAPMWFNVLDLVLAYIPMAWIGGIMALRFRV